MVSGGGGGTQDTSGWQSHSSHIITSFLLYHDSLVALTMVRSGGINSVLIGHDLPVRLNDTRSRK